MSPDPVRERDFLQRSLADARREHDAGDLSDEDYELLRRRDEDRLAALERTVAGAPGAPGAAGPAGAVGPTEAPATPRGAVDPAHRRARRRANRYGLVGAVLLLAGAVVLVLHLTTARLPGQVATGDLQLSQAQRIGQELNQAASLLATGQQSGAVRLYTTVLGQDPNDPQALAQLGWLTYEQGALDRRPTYVATGRSLVQRALAVDPGFGPAHLYDGVILLDGDHDPRGAVGQFEQFLQEHPSLQNLTNGAPFIRQAFAEAGRALPPGIPARRSAGPSTPTGATSTTDRG